MCIDLFFPTTHFSQPIVYYYRYRGNNFRKFINFLAKVKHGSVDGVKVRLSSLQALIPTSYIENLEVTMDEDADKTLQKRLNK